MTIPTHRAKYAQSAASDTGWATVHETPAIEPTRRGSGLASRLPLAQALVMLAGTLTAWSIAATIGPSVFHEHLARAKVGSPAQISHTEEAF